jgi:glutathione S-transferase
LSAVSFDSILTGPGLRLVLLTGVPSPWSEAALAIFRYKQLPFVYSRARPTDPVFQSWKGAWNLPAVLLDESPVRTGWGEILALAERLAPEPRLLPHDAEARLRTIGLCHELMSEGGLMWNARLLAIDRGLVTEGREGFPLRAAQYLAPRYGWQTSCAELARKHALRVLALLDAELARNQGPYYAGGQLTALDLYSAAAMNILVPLPDSICPIVPPLRAAFTWMGQTLGEAISPALLQHRDRVVSEFFEAQL